MSTRARHAAIAALLAGLVGGGCATMEHATSYSAGQVSDNIREDFEGHHYFAGTAHAILSPLTFLAVLIGDPAARTPPAPPRKPETSGSS